MPMPPRPNSSKTSYPPINKEDAASCSAAAGGITESGGVAGGGARRRRCGGRGRHHGGRRRGGGGGGRREHRGRVVVGRHGGFPGGPWCPSLQAARRLLLAWRRARRCAGPREMLPRRGQDCTRFPPKSG